MTWEILFWLCVLLLLHSYLFYPLLLRLWSNNKPSNKGYYTRQESLPGVTILMSVYNEEEVIQQKLESILRSHYPAEKTEVIIGSDGSDDQTNHIIRQFQQEHQANITLKIFEERKGKAWVLNQIQQWAHFPILILTDANVLFENETVYQLVKHFKNPKISLVGANIVNTGLKKEGISIQEKTYIEQENQLKHREGKLWGSAMGVFGGCYAIRKQAFPLLPPGTIVDDFYITMYTLQLKGHVITEPKAVCYEDVSNNVSEEFRRKVRISMGNFQNLQSFIRLLWPPWSGIAFSFLSHKIIRWLGPLLLLGAVTFSAILAIHHIVYMTLLIMQCLLFFVPLCDYLLRQWNIHLTLLRFISHFYLMNAALFIGFLKYLKGVETNVWEPTQRYQS